MMTDEVTGANVRRLIACKAARDAVPPGGGLQEAVRFLSDSNKLVSGTGMAVEWVGTVLALIRGLPDPNPWREASDEEIAGFLLGQIDSKRKGS